MPLLNHRLLQIVLKKQMLLLSRKKTETACVVIRKTVKIIICLRIQMIVRLHV